MRAFGISDDPDEELLQDTDELARRELQDDLLELDWLTLEFLQKCQRKTFTRIIFQAIVLGQTENDWARLESHLESHLNRFFVDAHDEPIYCILHTSTEPPHFTIRDKFAVFLWGRGRRCYCMPYFGPLHNGPRCLPERLYRVVSDESPTVRRQKSDLLRYLLKYRLRRFEFPAHFGKEEIHAILEHYEISLESYKDCRSQIQFVGFK